MFSIICDSFPKNSSSSLGKPRPPIAVRGALLQIAAQTVDGASEASRVASVAPHHVERAPSTMQQSET